MNKLIIVGDKAWLFKYKRKKFVGITHFDSITRIWGRVSGRVDVIFVDDSLAVRTFELPSMPSREINFVVSRELESEFGKDWAWTWIVAEVFFEGEVKKLRVSAILIRTERLKQFFQIIDRLRQEGARPKRLIPLGFALFAREDCAIFCLVNNFFCASFLKSGNPIFSRVFKMVDTSVIPDEIARTVNFARSKYGWEPPKIYIFSDFPLEVSMLDAITTLSGISDVEVLSFDEIERFIPSSFPRDKTADFLPRESFFKKYYIPFLRYASWGLLGLAVFQVILGVSKLNEYGKRKREVTELELRKRQLESRIKKLKEETDIDPSRVVYVEAIRKISSPETSLKYAIVQFAKATPPWLVVKNITLSRKKKGGWVLEWRGQFEVERALDISEKVEELKNSFAEIDFFESVVISEPSFRVREGKIVVDVIGKFDLVSE